MGEGDYGKGHCLQLAIAWLNKVLGEEADYGPAFACLWDRVAFTYGGLCSHSPLLEGVAGDLSLSAEELESIAQAVKIHNREQQAANGRRRRANPDALPGFRQRQKAVWERSQVNVRERYRKNVAEKNFYCATCNVAARDIARLTEHERTAGNINRVARDIARLKKHERTAGHLNRVARTVPKSKRKPEIIERRRRDFVNKRFHCAVCNITKQDGHALKKHEKTAGHIKRNASNLSNQRSAMRSYTSSTPGSFEDSRNCEGPQQSATCCQCSQKTSQSRCSP